MKFRRVRAAAQPPHGMRPPPGLAGDESPWKVYLPVSWTRTCGGGEQNIMSLQTFEERLITEVAQASDLLRQLASSGTAELMEKHRHELARLSQEELSGAGTTKLAQLAASLECIAGTSHGARLAVGEVARVMNNCVVLACCRELTKDDVAVLGKAPGLPSGLRAVLVSVLREAMPEASDDAISSMMSRLGVAKYHCFTAGVKFSRRRRKG